MATARAVFRRGRRASVSLVWRTCFGGSDARRAAFAFRWREPLCGERFVNSLRLRQLVQASTLLDRRAHQPPDHISRRRLAPAWIEPGHSSRPFLARDVPDPRFPILRGLAGRLVLPSCRPAALMGLRPSQVCSRCGWTRHASTAATWNDDAPFARHSISEHLCSSGPTCLLIDRVRAPAIFVGVIGGLRGYNRSERRPTRTSSIRSGFWASLPRPIRFAGALRMTSCDRSCLGLCLLQGCRTRVDACTSAGSSPLRVTSLRRPDLPVVYPLMGLWRPSRLKDRFDGCRRNDLPPAGLLDRPGSSRACPSAY